MEKGLTSKQAEENLKTFGENRIEVEEKFSPLLLFLSQFPTLINAILGFAAVFSFVIKNIIDGTFIIFILFLNALFGFIQEYKAEKSLEKLKSLAMPMSRVFRNGKEVQIQTLEIVPGDVVVLNEGDRIPADGKIITGHHLEIDESVLTGESLPVEKAQNDSVFSGTLVTKGKGYLFVEKTGMNTRFGNIAKTLSTIETDKTPLQISLTTLGKLLSFAAIITAFLLIPIGVFQGRQLFPLILLATSVGVAAIPEGLPAVITIALGLGTNRMAKKNAIVRKMQSVETLGAVQVVLTDKTGTLTQNKMSVKKVFIRDGKMTPFLVKCCVFGNTASLIKKIDGSNAWEIVGDKTDGALLAWAQEQIDVESLKKEGEIIDEYVFDPATKTITTLWEKENKRIAFVRGSPETIFSKSNLTKKEKEDFEKLFKDYASEGLRVIAFAKKTVNHQKTQRNLLESDLEFLGFFGIYDPPRIEVKKSLEDARKAGIRTVMVTGDNELTALAIAKEVGLFEGKENIVTGQELDHMSDEELEKIIEKTVIFARTKPEDKLRLVSAFKKLGFVVAVTGDGVNDALALKKADVGVAMGEKGTDVAKEASDIILINDNYSVLINAIEEGRTIYNNIAKSITYLLSGNLSELSLVLFATILGLPNPLLPTQILWINLITDGLPALALAGDNKNHDVLKLSPRDPKSPILTKGRIIFISIVGFGLAVFLLAIFKLLLITGHSEVFARTVLFNTLVFTHLGIALFVRKNAIFKVNRFLFLSIVGTIILQIIITTTPFFQKILHLGF